MNKTSFKIFIILLILISKSSVIVSQNKNNNDFNYFELTDTLKVRVIDERKNNIVCGTFVTAGYIIGELVENNIEKKIVTLILPCDLNKYCKDEILLIYPPVINLKPNLFIKQEVLKNGVVLNKNFGEEYPTCIATVGKILINRDCKSDY